MAFLNNIRSAFAHKVDVDQDRGDVIQTIIIASGFMIATYLTVNWISGAVTNKAADVAECIEGASSYTAQDAATKCAKVDHSKKNSFKNDAGYKGRYK